MTGPLVSYDRKGQVGVVTIDNPPLNILSQAVRDELTGLLAQIEADEAVRVVILTGAGERAFCAGADLSEEGELTTETIEGFLESDSAVYDAVQTLRVPAIAAINGHCFGGGLELALACDIRIVAEEAKLGAVGVKIGVVASTARLTSLLGPAIASDLILTARTIDGREAERLHVVSRAVPKADLLGEACSWAELIAQRAPLAVARAKLAIREAASQPLSDALSRERRHYAELSLTDDHRHAVEAFFRREAPVFHGR